MQFAENYRNISRNWSTQPRKQKKNFVNRRVKIRQTDRQTNKQTDR